MEQFLHEVLSMTVKVILRAVWRTEDFFQSS